MRPPNSAPSCPTRLGLSEAVERFAGRDPALKCINLYNMRCTDAELGVLVDCLLAHPDVVTNVYLGSNELTDETGIKLARYVAASSTIESLNLYHNQLGEATYLAFAAALRVNLSLRFLHLPRNQPVDWTRIDAAFVEALRLNPGRPARSAWYLYSTSNDFERLKPVAFEMGHPSLQLLLAARLLTDDQLAATQLWGVDRSD